MTHGSSNDFDVLPSPSGQRTEMPTKKGPDLSLGPYSPRDASTGMPHKSPPGDFELAPTPSGQYPHAGAKLINYPAPQAHSALPTKGASGDLDVLPTPSGQNPHAKNQDSAKDGGGMC